MEALAEAPVTQRTKIAVRDLILPGLERLGEYRLEVPPRAGDAAT